MMKKYVITYHTQLDNGYIDERQIMLKNKYNAKRIYDKIASKKRTVNIELEELYWPTQPPTVSPSIQKTKLSYSQSL